LHMQYIDNIPVWGTHEENTLEQAKLCARSADYMALMADGHLGYGVPIGGVIASENRISPTAVGFDIACGKQGRASRHPSDGSTCQHRPHTWTTFGAPSLLAWAAKILSVTMTRPSSTTPTKAGTPKLRVRCCHKAHAQLGTIG